MPLTQAHDEKRVLSPEKVAQHMRGTFLDIMALDQIERAEVLEALYDQAARVKMRVAQKDDLTFELAHPTLQTANAPVSRYTIPGEGKPAASLPLRAAVYVHANSTSARFGGATVRQDKPRPDGTVPIVNVPATPNFISFELETPEL